MGYMGFLLLSFLVATGYAKPQAVCDLDISKGGVNLHIPDVAWDGDFRRVGKEWVHRSFVGAKWHQVKKEEHQRYLKNTYRVLLTRARQGMVIYVPKGEAWDPTRAPEYYDGTYEYLRGLGIEEV
jgi:hypothetical protein